MAKGLPIALMKNSRTKREENGKKLEKHEKVIKKKCRTRRKGITSSVVDTQRCKSICIYTFYLTGKIDFKRQAIPIRGR